MLRITGSLSLVGLIVILAAGGGGASAPSSLATSPSGSGAAREVVRNAGTASLAARGTKPTIAGLPLPLPRPTPPPAGAPPAQPAPRTATISLDLGHLGAPLNPAIVGVDEDGGYAQGIWNANPSGLPTPALYSAAAADTAALHLGLMRMEPAVNDVPGCTPSMESGDCGQYRWQDHLGPSATRLWRDPQMGLDDYMATLRQTAPGSQPFIVANMETATVQDIAEEVAYTNGTSGAMASWRQTNTGGAGPYDIVSWELGNEEYDHLDALRAELADPARNPANCPDYTASESTDFTAGELYGCLLAGYGSAMRAAEASSGGRVSLRIVAGVGSDDWIKGIEAAAPGAFDDVDFHDYSAPSDSSNVVFDRDGQWTSFTVQPVSGVVPAQVTYAFWATGSDDQGAPVLEAKLDGTRLALRHACGSTDCTGAAITWGNYSPMPELLVATALTSPGTHKLAITACAPSSVGFGGGCPAAGSGSTITNLLVNVRHVSTAAGAQTTSEMMSSRQGLKPISCVTWRPDPDTPVATTSTVTQPASSTQPWRLSDGDYATATTAALQSSVQNKLGDLRTALTTAPGAGIFIGEHAFFGGCDATPLSVTETQEAGLAAAERIIGYFSAAGQPGAPLRGAAFFALNGYAPNGPYCAGIALVREVSGTVNGSPDCLAPNRPDAAYLTAVGQDFALTGALTRVAGGLTVPMSIDSATVDLPRVVDQRPARGVPAVAGVAFRYSDGSVRLLLVNSLPGTALTETIGGAQFSAATATSVYGDPGSGNSDQAQNAVAPHAVPTSVTNGEAAITLPPFSCTLVVLH